MTRPWSARRLPRKQTGSRTRGQAMVESFFVIMLLCLIFWGFLQAALLYNHERVLQFASFAAARSAAVGYQPQIYTRAYQVAAIPASGAMLTPTASWSGPNQQYQQLGVEQMVIPLYLGMAPTGNMDYTYWEQYNMQPGITASPTTMTEQHYQQYPMEMPVISYVLFGQTNATITMMGNISTTMAAHYPLYLQ